jgi:hypothetical protein
MGRVQEPQGYHQVSERDLANAKLEVVAARERMLESVHALQARLAPASLAGDAWDDIREKGGEVAGRIGRAAARRPVATGAAVAGVAALLARKPLWRLVARWTGKTSDGDE